MGDVADHRTWNIFRRRHAHGLCCAVPSDASVPTFLLTGDWIFGFQFRRGDVPVPGLSLQAAEVGAQYNGFYLFLGFGSRGISGAAPPASASLASPPPADREPNGHLVHSPRAGPSPT